MIKKNGLYYIFVMILLFKFVNMFEIKKDVCQVLSFSGGGSFGAVEVGILSEIALDKYDIITGVSAGGLNAGFLSYYNSDNTKLSDGIDNLSNIYNNLNNSDVYTHNTAQIYRSWSYYDTTPLRKTITKELSKLNCKEPKTTLIGSTNLNTGGFQIFRFDTENKINQVDLLMATSAIPLVFPPVKFNSNYYVDGGAIANEIINGIESYVNCINYNITFISSSNKINQISSIESFEDYIKRISQVVLTNFNNELTEIMQDPCPDNNLKGIINYCYPTSIKLNDYSMLDFSHGKELFEIGKKEYTCEKINYC